MYLLQRGQGCSPAKIAKLPTDISDLPKGDWKYSEELQSWLGWDLSIAENIELYRRGIL
jgi:hypothetical protein